MINTHSGEMVEPRIGDVIRTLTGRIFTIDDIRGDMVYEDIEEQLGASSNGCTLLHRPFVIGDEVQKLDDFNVWDNWNYHVLDNEKELGIAESKPDRHRHKNPAWRDHPDYKPG